MEESTTELARDLMRVGDFDGARRIAEAEIERAGSDRDSTELWRLRFIRAQTLEAYGQVEGALSYLESLLPPLPTTSNPGLPLGCTAAPTRARWTGSGPRMGCLAKQKVWRGMQAS